jgi:hypothetical protein
MDLRGMKIYPVLSYHIISNPELPTIAVMALVTEMGAMGFALQKEHVEEVAAALQRHAETMPRKTDQN